jgi:hypothetical protein
MLKIQIFDVMRVFYPINIVFHPIFSCFWDRNGCHFQYLDKKNKKTLLKK